MLQFEVLKKGTTVYIMKDNKIVTGRVGTNEIIVNGNNYTIENYINIETESGPIQCLVLDEDCFLSKEELIKSL